MTPRLETTMEPLELFSLEALDRANADTTRPERVEGPESISLISAEHLEVAEAFLGDNGRAEDARARIEAAMFLCEGAGDVSAPTLQRLTVDRNRYPRAAAALDDTKEALALPPGEWPEGFWPRFLLRVLAES